MTKKMDYARLKTLAKKCVEFCRKAASYAWKRTRHNFGLKMISVIAAILLRNMIMTQSNPVRRVPVNDVLVVYSGLETLQNNNLTLSPESRANLAEVDVSLGVRMQELSRVSSDKVSARASLSAITEPGTHELAIQVSSELGTVYTQSQSKIKVDVERLVSKMVPVRSEIQGTAPEGYSVGSVSLTPNVIEVTGPESLVNRVYQATVQLDVSNLTQSYTGSQNFVLMDAEGEAVETLDLDLSAVGAVADVQMKKTVALPVNAALSLAGASLLPDGYALSGVEVVPSAVNVTGSDTALSGVVELNCDAIDIAGLTESKTYNVRLKPISGLSFETSTVDVVVRVEPKLKTETFRDVEVQLINLAEGLKLPEGTEAFTVDVTVSGPESVVSRLRERNISAVIDARDLLAGSHQVKVSVALDEAYQNQIDAGNVLVSPTQMTLILEQERVNDPVE